jgi:hypothetical protein
LNVTGRIGHDELASRRREVAISHVDGDALFSLGAQAVGQKREVDVLIAARGARGGNGVVLILEDGLAVIQQTPDERAFSVVNTACGRKPQQFHIEITVC